MYALLYYSFLVLGVIMTCFISARYASLRSWIGVFLAGFLFNIIWATCTKFSNRLIFDAIVYDSLVTIFYVTALVYFTQPIIYHWYNWAGLILAVMGLVLFKIKF